MKNKARGSQVLISLMIVLAWVGLASIPGTRRVGAGTFTVTNTDDSGPGSLRQAILDANATPGADTINFDPNVAGTITLMTGQLPDIADDLSITGPGTTSITISGNNASRVFKIVAGTTVWISGLRVSNGLGDFGGGVKNAGTLTITSCTLSENSAVFGGGIYNESNATLTVSDARILGNSAIGDGGGIDNSFGSLTINESTMSGNSAAFGGAIHNLRTLTITDSLLVNNSATDFGGGIFGGTVTIINSNLSANSASGGGGISNSIMLTISNSLLSNNSALNGGGIAFGGTKIITNCTLSGNSANFQGGGIYSCCDALSISNSTLANNYALAGGGIFGDVGGAQIKNSIIANSISGGNFAGPGTLTAVSVNFSTDGTCPGFIQITADQINLGPLQDNGGPTKTHALLSGSVAIDAVTDCTDLAGNLVAQDQRGVTRPIDGNSDGIAKCDVGAYEAAAPAFDICLQDDSNRTLLQINSTTGDYQFTNCSGFTLSGTGSLIKKGSIITLQHYAADRRVLARNDTSVNKGTASIQVFSQGTTFTITDRNTANNACACP